MRLVLLVAFTLSISQNIWASMYYVNPKGLSHAQLENFKKQLLTVHKLLPKVYKKINYINIRFKKFKVRKNVHMAYYSRWQAQIVFNKDIIPEKGFSFQLHKTIIHELTHVYEDKVKDIHSDLKFQYISGWHKRGFFLNMRKRRNFLEQRSPDPYEFSHPRETLAVNLEFFLSQKDFKCRRPIIYNYLVKELNHQPFKDYKCNVISKVPVHIKGRIFFRDINFENLYEVHYLKASQGKDIISGFGHSMLRLVMCSPKRKEKSAACLQDFEHHLILSYRANVLDTFINYWAGLTGKYPSQLFIMTLTEVLTEYNETEFRDVISYPIKMSNSELQNVITNTIKEIWTYQGKYRFITQNCATETMDFLKVVMNNEEILSKRITTPEGIYNKLYDLDLFYRDEHKNYDERVVNYVYKSKYEIFLTLFDGIKEYFNGYDLEDYIHQSSADERAYAFNLMIQSNVKTSMLAKMRALEQHIDLVKGRSFLKIATKIILSGKDVPKFLKEYLVTRIELESLSGDMKGYGIPLQQDLKFIEKIVSGEKHKQDIQDKFQKWFKENYNDFFYEKNKRDQNLVSFLNEIVTRYSKEN